MDSKKFYKVWNSSRLVKKSLAASSLRELVSKGAEKLGYSGSGGGGGSTVRVVLEEDGTIVEDEDYFELLKTNTTFILLTDGESWKPVSETAGVDLGLGLDLDLEEDSVDYGEASVPRIEQLASILRSDFSKLITFNKQDLQEIVDADVAQLQSLLSYTAWEVSVVKDSCQRFLDEQLEADESIRLVHMMAGHSQLEARRMDGEGEGEGVADAKRPKRE